MDRAIQGYTGSALKRVRIDALGQLMVVPGLDAQSGFHAHLTRTTAGGAYAQYDCIGTVWTIEPPVNPGESFWFQLDTLTVVDPAGLLAGLTFWFFSLDPSANGSTVTNNAAVAFGAASKAVLLGKVEVLAADYTVSDGTEGVATVTNLALQLGSDDAGKIYVVVTKQEAGSTDFGGGSLYYSLGFSRR